MWNWLISGLASGATLLLYDGSPFHPDGNVLFDFAAEERCTFFGTSAKFIDACVKKTVCLSSISGGTDIVSCFVLGNPIGPVWRGEIQCRGLGMNVEVWNDEGRPVVGEKGELVSAAPFPSMPVEFWNDPEGQKYFNAYFARFLNVWCHGDYV